MNQLLEIFADVLRIVTLQPARSRAPDVDRRTQVDGMPFRNRSERFGGGNLFG